MDDDDDNDFDDIEEEIAGGGDDQGGNDSNTDGVHSDISEGGWISWFCQLEGNEMLVEVDEDFIRSSTNLFGVTGIFKNYKLSILLNLH